MLRKALAFLLIASSLIVLEGFPRKDAKAQSSEISFVPLRLCGRNFLLQRSDLPIEILPVLELPLSVHEASLFKSEKGYLLKLSIANSSDVKIIGLRYALFTINEENKHQIRVNRTEGFSIPAYETKSLTFKTPIKFRQKGGERLVLMLEQVVSHESIWEVVKAKEALEAYAKGDYSVMPAVMRVANQVDAPMSPRMPYEE